MGRRMSLMYPYPFPTLLQLLIFPCHMLYMLHINKIMATEILARLCLMLVTGILFMMSQVL